MDKQAKPKSCLMEAVLRSDAVGVHAAVAAGNDLTAYDENVGGVSVLFYAITRGDFETVSLLVELGADVNQPVWSDQSGSPLWFARSFWGMLEIADFLADHGAVLLDSDS